ncbi:hypothetical protein [Methylobacter sp. S3L5C]|uniref:hypothetical protein n=1 Tax=Methylobacter sp. S3L5C TaxID=2839024 RepID=UPI001FADA023|nr:hypothetical protein [Methylobacter sp. S3L5C]UOA08118.1 hypothetical protein KKZ03_18140 [Methylobacter sp. S3L5C]
MKNNGLILPIVVVLLTSVGCAGLAKPIETKAQYDSRQCKELSNMGGVAFALRKSGESFSQVVATVNPEQDVRTYIGLAYDLPISYTREQSTEELFRICMMTTPPKDHRYDFKSSYRGH